MGLASKLRIVVFVAVSIALEVRVISRHGLRSMHEVLVVVAVPIAVAVLVWIGKILSGNWATKAFLVVGSFFGIVLSLTDQRDLIVAVICGGVFFRALWELLTIVGKGRDEKL